MENQNTPSAANLLTSANQVATDANNSFLTHHCKNSDYVYLSTVSNLTATGTAIKWYSVQTSGTALLSSATLTSGTTYYASQTVGACESTTRLAVTVTIGATSPPTGAASQSFCSA